MTEADYKIIDMFFNLTLSCKTKNSFVSLWEPLPRKGSRTVLSGSTFCEDGNMLDVSCLDTRLLSA